MNARQLQTIARQQGTPIVVIDHNIIRANFANFRKHLPKIQAYYAVKANAEPAIVRTLYQAGASFDVASLPEFMLVYENIKHLDSEMLSTIKRIVCHLEVGTRRTKDWEDAVFQGYAAFRHLLEEREAVLHLDLKKRKLTIVK